LTGRDFLDFWIFGYLIFKKYDEIS